MNHFGLLLELDVWAYHKGGRAMRLNLNGLGREMENWTLQINVTLELWRPGDGGLSGQRLPSAPRP